MIEEKSFAYKYRNWFSFLNIILNLAILAVGLSAIMIEWFHYCYFDWGLLNLTTSKDDLSEIINDSSDYSSVNDHMCGNFKSTIDAACSDFCGNLERNYSAGIVMVIFMVLTLTFSLCYLVIHILELLNRKVNHYLVYYGVWMQSLIYGIAITVYIAIINFYAVKTT